MITTHSQHSPSPTADEQHAGTPAVVGSGRRRVVALVAALLTLVGVLGGVVTPTAAEGTGQTSEAGTAIHDTAEIRYLHQVDRLYQTTLNRDPDVGGMTYWANQLQQGGSTVDIARGFLQSDEVATRGSGDPVADAYRWALGREPDPEGYQFWSQRDAAEAVVAISDSPEHQDTSGTLPPPPPVPAEPVRPAGVPAWYADAGSGVYVPPILLKIRWCESRNDYRAANRISSARGAYQFLRSSWRAYGHASRYGVSEAHLATPAQQDEAALITWQRSGTSPWNASRHCWR